MLASELRKVRKLLDTVMFSSLRYMYSYLSRYDT